MIFTVVFEIKNIELNPRLQKELDPVTNAN